MQYVSITFRDKKCTFQGKIITSSTKKDSFFFSKNLYIIFFLLPLPYKKNNDVIDIKKILDKIAKRRKKKGYSYENMAEDLGLTPSGYRKIEKGETKLSVERLFQIAAALDISVNKLLNIDETSH